MDTTTHNALVIERLIYTENGKFRWVVYDPSNSHVFEQGYCKHRGVADNQTKQTTFTLAETLGLPVILQEFDGTAVMCS